MPIDEIISDGTNMVVGAAQGAVADQLPETIIVTPDNNLERPTDVRLPKDVNWYNSSIDIFNADNKTKLPKVTTEEEIADDDYTAVSKHIDTKIIQDYNKTNEELKLGLPIVTSVTEIKPEDAQKVDKAKVVKHITTANKELKLAQEIFGKTNSKLMKFEPFKSVDDIRTRGEEYGKIIEEATVAKNKSDQNKLLSGVNDYIAKVGVDIPLFKDYETAKKAITPVDGKIPLEQQINILLGDKAPTDEEIIRQNVLNPMPNDMPEAQYNARVKGIKERAIKDEENARKRRDDIYRLSRLAPKTKGHSGESFLDVTDAQYLETSDVYNTIEDADKRVAEIMVQRPNLKGVGVKTLPDGTYEVQVPEQESDAKWHQQASEITANSAIKKQDKANALMPEYNALKSEIKLLTSQGMPIPEQTMQKFNDVTEDIQNYLDAAQVLSNTAEKNYLKFNKLEAERGGFWSGLALEGVKTSMGLSKALANTMLSIAPYLSKDIAQEDVTETINKVNDLVKKAEDFYGGKLGVTRQYMEKASGLEGATQIVLGIVPYMLAGEAALPLMIITGFSGEKEALADNKDLTADEKNLVSLVKGTVGALVMHYGLKAGKSGNIINDVTAKTINLLPKAFTLKTLKDIVGKELTQAVSNTVSSGVGFAGLNMAAVGANKLTDEIVNAVKGKEVFADTHDIIGEAFTEAKNGLLTGMVLGGVTSIIKGSANKLQNESEFRMVDEIINNPAQLKITILKLRQQVIDKTITPDQYKKAYDELMAFSNIASQIPKDFSNSSRYQSFKLLKENAGYEKQKAGLAPVYIKRIDGLIEANNAELIKIADNESIKSIPNDTQNPETTNSESTTTDGTNEIATQETKVVDDGAKVENDVVSLADKIRKLKTQKGALNSDITFGLRNYAIEEIAQLVEDGIEVAKAIGKVLSDKRYKDLNKDEIEKAIYGLNHTEVVNGFYSSLEKTINESKLDKLPAKQWAEKFKGEEAKWTGLTDWLSQQTGSVSKADIQKFLKDNRVEIVEVVKGEKVSKGTWVEKDGNYYNEKTGQEIVEYSEGDDGEMLYQLLDKDGMDIRGEAIPLEEAMNSQDEEYSGTKFSQYQLEGEKENYKEVLVTMPSVEYKPTSAELEKMAKENYGKSYSELNDAQQKNTAQYVLEDRRGGKTAFKSSHFDEPNILVHLRMNTRTDADGKKVLFLEEVQSDWGQKGKKEGFDNKQLEAKRNELLDKMYALELEHQSYTKRTKVANTGNVSDYRLESTNEKRQKEIEAEVGKLDAEVKKINAQTGITPEAPFVIDTNAWTKLGLKVALKEAVKQGADKIAWTTGEQQNDRYDLQKQVDFIDVFTNDDGTYHIIAVKGNNTISEEKSLKENQLEGLLGKDLTKKIIEDTKNHTHKEGEENLVKTYRGNDLSVGGKGMKGFYGSPTEGSLGIVGNVAKSLFKQEPKTINIETAKNNEYTLGEANYVDGIGVYDGKGDMVAEFDTKAEANKFIAGKSNSIQHSIDITPELKKQVESGQSLFDKNTETKTLADKVRALKSKKGTLQTDITGGLKDYALEEIAQLIEDGTVVIEAIRKVLANSKYASLNKDEIRNLVFSVNPLTEKDFERNDSEKVVDRNKRLEADLKQRGYTQNEIDYILRGGVDRIEKVDTVREETKVVDNLNKILKSVQAKAKDMPLKEAVDKAIEQVQGDWVKGKEIILENAIRKFKKEHEIAVTNPTDRAVKPKPIMITVDEKKALTDQIKLEVKAATEGAKSITDGFKEVSKIVNEILKQHKTTISTRQLNAIQKRMAYLKVGSNESVRKYVDYIEKVLANAEYADQLASVKSTNKKLKKALKNDKIPASVRATANDFIKLDPADVENLNKHEVYANELLEAMKSGGIKVQDGNVIDKTRKAADLSKIDNYIEKEMALAEKRAEQSMNEEYQTTAEAEDNTDEIKAYVQRKFDNMKAMVGRMIERGVDMDGNPIDFTPEEVSMIKKVIGMKLDQLDNIKDWYEATEALDHLLTNGDLGLIPHILNKYQNAVTVKKGTQTLINKMAGNISLLPITKFFAQMEKLVTTTIPFGKRNPKDSYGTKIFFDNSSFRRWDNLVKNFKDYGIYESTFYHLAKAYANYKTLVRQMDAQRISKELFASNGYDQKKTLESKFKITAFLRQLEFESNPESKTNKPAIDYLNATIEAAENLNHPIQGKALDMLKDVVSKHTVDGQISLESLRNSFTQGEKKAIADLQKTYKALAPYHNKVSLAIRNKAFTAIENYTHISAYGTKTKGLSATETKKNEYLSVLQGTKSGTIEERSGATSPINLDPFATANKAIRDVMLDYFMTNPFRNVEKILDNFAKYSIEELKKYPRGTAEYENALKRKNIADAWLDIYSDARENMLGRSYFETNPFKEFMQLAAKRAVEFTLGKPDRLLAELFSNIGFVMSSATKEFALGSTKYLKYNGGEIQAKIMENVQSSATERLHPHGGIATSVMDTQDFDIAVADDQNISSPVRRKALQFYYNTLAKGIGTGQMINEGMITSGDLLIARPIWTGTMATEFKKITGKDIDFDKISENDIEYMDANEEAIDKARTVADRNVTDAAASKNPFETAPKMSNRSTQILQALNTYMRGFNMNEYELASDALMHLVKGGKMSAKDATRILSGISARAGLYKAVQAKAATAMMAAIMGGWAMLQNDEEKTEVDKLIGNMGDDTPENRRKVAAKLLELFATSNPNIPELAGMGKVGDALKTTDEETVKFWKRATEEPNTFIEDFVKGIGQQYLSLLTQRNFGNIVQGFLTAPLFEEYVNKKLRDDYDPYKDSYLYSKLPDTGKKNWLIRSIEANLGAYGLPLAMLMDITVAGIELRINIKKLDAVNEELKKHIDKVPLEKNKLEDWYDLKDRQKSLEKKIEYSYKSIAKEVAIAAGMGTGAIPALKNIDKAMDKIMQDAYKLPKDWEKIQEKIEAIKNGVAPEDIMNAENKQKAVSEIYDVIEPGEKMPDKYDDAIKKVLEK